MDSTITGIETDPLDNITIVDVAKEAGVSYSTVSRVLNEEAYVKEATRKRVTDAIDSLGYVANQQARSLRGGKSMTIGLIVRTLGSEYIGAIVRGIDSRLIDAGYDLMVYTTHKREMKESQYVQMMTQGMVDGLLLILPRNGDQYLDKLCANKFPHVIIDDSNHNIDSPAVLVDNYNGGYQATTHLLELGHRDIAFITGEISVRAAVERQRGYLAALAEYGLSPHSVVEGDFFQPSGYRAAKKILRAEKRPTAIVASNDSMAFGVVEAANELGIDIPASLSLTGFDDIPQAVAIQPRLTTARQPLKEMGQVAGQMLLDHIKKPDKAVERRVLATEFVVRESSAPADLGTV